MYRATYGPANICTVRSMFNERHKAIKLLQIEFLSKAEVEWKDFSD